LRQVLSRLAPATSQFFSSFDASLSNATEACNDGLYPVMSFKTGGYPWAQGGRR
jgi:hypothetical protein